MEVSLVVLIVFGVVFAVGLLNAFWA